MLENKENEENEENKEDDVGEMARRAVIVCVIVVLFVCAFTLIRRATIKPYMDESLKYTTVSSPEEALAYFGDGLLIDFFAVPDGFSEPEVKYTLRHGFSRGPYGLGDLSTWIYLRAEAEYDGGAAVLWTYFAPESEEIPKEDSLKELRRAFVKKPKAKMVGCTKVKYVRLDAGEFEYEHAAEFIYGAHTCFLKTYSNRDDALFWDTLEAMLA